MMTWLLRPWPWYIAGPLIGLSVPLLLIVSGKTLGISSSFRHLCSIATPNSPFAYIRDNDWRKESWNLLFVLGIVVGGFVANGWLSAQPLQFLPESYYSRKGVIFGGVLFGLGWAITGACPGPIYAQIGSGEFLALITLAGGLIGAYLYAYTRPYLPH